MSGLRSTRNIVIATGLGGMAAFFLLPRTLAKANPVQNGFDVTGAQNVADRYSKAGGSTTYLPAVATPLNDPNDNTSQQKAPTGVDSATFEDRHSDQKIGEAGTVGKAWNQAHHGNSKGK